MSDDAIPNFSKVSSRKDFSEFVILLRDYVASNPDAVENDKVDRFLEAISAYSIDIEHLYRNYGREFNEASDWQLFAEILSGAIIYE